MADIQREKGAVRKFNYLFRTLDDYTLKDSLQAVSLLNDKEPYYLVGGIATQSYIPSSCRRPTADIDFSIVRPLNYTDFKLMIEPLVEYFRDSGYSTQTRKGSRAYGVDVTNPEGETVSLEFSRRNDKAFNNNKNRLERELENSNLKILEERDSTYRVARTEDIAVPKIVRSIGSLQRNPSFFRHLPREVESLSDEKIVQQLRRIESLRNEAVVNIPDPELAERLRFISDLYDVRVLSEIAGFNQNYLDKVEGDWNIFLEGSKEKDRLLNSVLPKFH